MNIAHLSILILINGALVFTKICSVQNASLMRNKWGGDVATALYDIVKGFPETKIAMAFQKMDPEDLLLMMKKLQDNHVSVAIFNLSSEYGRNKYFNYLTLHAENHNPLMTVFFGRSKLYEHILLQIYGQNCIHRNLVYIFYWGGQSFTKYFLKNIHYSMRVIAITNPREDTFRLYYSQATSYKDHHLEMINWWNQGKGLFNHPTIPKRKSIYKDFHGRILQVPVLHKPPWHFVKYNSSHSSFEVIGGRDHRILSFLSKQLNFRYNYSDPPERIQGSADADNNKLFTGVLGLLSKREADLFIGDMGITYERAAAVEFSFITLADSGAFVTHAPSKLNEALALLRPFQWQVWPAIGVTCVIVGPFLYILIALPNLWHPRFRVRSHVRLFFDCTWFTVTILLKQTGKEPSDTHKARFFIILLSVSATYVITDMYSANLTSLLARPGREKAINDLYQLKNVMQEKDFQLFVEKHSPSFGLLENGTGIYGQLWELMEKTQNKYVVESVEDGVKLVRDKKNVAVMAGRETLFFDIQRFGNKNFHLSEKLNTAYSAIALQIGCPYVEEINKILMAVFEAGIITKMTEDEYEKLGKQKEISSTEIQTNEVPTTKQETKRAAKVSEDNEKLKPIRLKMLQGTFYLLIIGDLCSGFVLLVEVAAKRYYRNATLRKRKGLLSLKIQCRRFRFLVGKFKNRFARMYRNYMHDAFTRTLEYVE